MKFLEIFSKNIFKLLAGKSLRKIRLNSIETVLSRSVSMIDQETIDALGAFLRSRQTHEGGFADRGGRSDLYYTLFGCFVAEALGVKEVMPSLRQYVMKMAQTGNPEGIQMKCAAILYSKLFGPETLPLSLRKTGNIQETYSGFINLLTSYYSEDYPALFRIRRNYRINTQGVELPCSVVAAQMILEHCSGKPVKNLEGRLYEFYRDNGSFAAVKGAPYGDLLSTGVALYSLRFVNSSVRIIKPDCLLYIDSLYSEGGFCATSSDPDPDVEYTFYGLLALGSLSD